MMTGKRFSDSFLDDVRARTGLVALIGQDVQLKRRGRDHWGLCPFHNERSPSFTVNEEKGFGHCFGCGWHGDAIDWIRARFGLDFAEAVEELAVRAGLQPDREGRVRPQARPIARPSTDDLEREKAQKVEWARSLWKSTGPASGTLVEAYLASRGIRLFPPPSLRFHPSCKHSDSGLLLPAMIGGVQDVHGRVVGVHRTFLRPDGQGKAKVDSAKKMGGVCWGGAVRFARAEECLCIAEGIETALSIVQATGMPTWAALSLGNMGAVDLPASVQEVILCADADAKDPAKAEDALRQAAERHAHAGRIVRIALPPVGMDFNDLLQADGEAA